VPTVRYVRTRTAGAAYLLAVVRYLDVYYRGLRLEDLPHLAEDLEK